MLNSQSHDETFPSTRDEAIRVGARFYFTGAPCKRGHVAARYAANTTCLECQRERKAVLVASGEHAENERKRRAERPEAVREASRKWREANPDKVKAAGDRWRAANPEKVKATTARATARARERRLASGAPPRPVKSPDRDRANWGLNRAVGKKGAGLPDGMTRRQVVDATVHIYAEAARLTSETGIRHHVDHIVPICMGGLHCPSNLQVLTASEHYKKDNGMYNGCASRSENKKVARKKEEPVAMIETPDGRLPFEVWFEEKKKEAMHSMHSHTNARSLDRVKILSKMGWNDETFCHFLKND